MANVCECLVNLPVDSFRPAVLYLFNYFKSYGTVQIVYFFVSQFGRDVCNFPSDLSTSLFISVLSEPNLDM